MKTTLEKEDIEAIAREVLTMVKPLLESNRGVEDSIFDVKGLAEYLKVEVPWVYQKIHGSELPYYKVGKYPRFRKSKIDEWLQKKERGKGKTPQSC